jgi:hypothetical protein
VIVPSTPVRIFCSGDKLIVPHARSNGQDERLNGLIAEIGRLPRPGDLLVALDLAQLAKLGRQVDELDAAEGFSEPVIGAGRDGAQVPIRWRRAVVRPAAFKSSATVATEFTPASRASANPLVIAAAVSMWFGDGR